jgi:Spy/CpxP family protein refolding chaperone
MKGIMRVKVMIVMMAVLMIGSQVTLSAQETENRAPKVKRERPTAEQMLQRQSARMANSLMLNDADAAKFEPLYQNYLKEMNALNPWRNKANMRKPDANAPAKRDSFSDEQASQILKDRFANDQQRLDIQQKYYKEFSKILTPKQVLKVFTPQKQPRMAMRSPRKQGRFGQHAR